MNKKRICSHIKHSSDNLSLFHTETIDDSFQDIHHSTNYDELFKIRKYVLLLDEFNDITFERKISSLNEYQRSFGRKTVGLIFSPGNYSTNTAVVIVLCHE